MEAWRIVKNKHAADAFSGEGAHQYGGRWNAPGTRVIYVSSSLSLAALELLAHLNAATQLTFSTFQLIFSEGLVETLATESLPVDWQAQPPGAPTQRIGDAWARAARSAVFAVPSAIIPGETNFLLNPAHPDFEQIQIGSAKPFAFDPRLLDA